MAEGHRMTAAQLADKLLQDEHADVLRESVAWMATQLMDAEVASRVGAELGERSPERTTHRNESRQRLLSTKAGDVELRIPKLAMCCVNRGVGQHEMVAGASRGPRRWGDRDGTSGRRSGGSSRPHADGLASEVVASTRCIRGLEEPEGPAPRLGRGRASQLRRRLSAPRRPATSRGSAGLTTSLPSVALDRDAAAAMAAPPAGGLMVGVVVGAAQHQRETGAANRVAGGGERHQWRLAVDVDASLGGVVPPAGLAARGRGQV